MYVILTILIDAGVTSGQMANMPDASSSSDTGYESCSVLSGSETSSSGASQLTKVRLRIVLHTLFTICGAKIDLYMPKSLFSMYGDFLMHKSQGSSKYVCTQPQSYLKGFDHPHLTDHG